MLKTCSLQLSGIFTPIFNVCLFKCNLDLNMVRWIVNFLSNRTQCVRVNGLLSFKLCSSIGSPHTNDCRSTFENRYIMKFADDAVFVSLRRHLIDLWWRILFFLVGKLQFKFKYSQPKT